MDLRIAGLRGLAAEADCTGPDGEFRTRVESFRPGAVYFRQEGDRLGRPEPASLSGR